MDGFIRLVEEHILDRLHQLLDTDLAHSRLVQTRGHALRPGELGRPTAPHPARTAHSPQKPRSHPQTLMLVPPTGLHTTSTLNATHRASDALKL